MKICLAGPHGRKFMSDILNDSKYYLESFYYMKPWLIEPMSKADMFMLDSGAFSFINGKGSDADFDEYLTRYINFINENDIKYFFELDIDSLVGIKKVEEYRDRLESETGKKCIPVWHKGRGKDYFIKMCEEYDYVSIGGIVAKEIKPADYKYFTWFINTAHSYGCKIHGLGFTTIEELFKYPFDTVDSTSWLAGWKFGTLYHFNGRMIKVVAGKEEKRRTDVNGEELDKWNFREWVKFQKYAEEHL